MTQIEKQNCLQLSVNKYKKRRKSFCLLKIIFLMTVSVYICSSVYSRICFGGNRIFAQRSGTENFVVGFQIFSARYVVYSLHKRPTYFPYLSLNFRKNGQLETLLRTLTLPENSVSFSVCSLVENVNRLSEQIDSTNRHQNKHASI